MTELCVLRVSVETYVAPKDPLRYKLCQRLGHTQRNCGYAPQCVACGETHLFRSARLQRSRVNTAAAVNHTAYYWGCSKWKEASAVLTTRASTERRQMSGSSGRSGAPKEAREVPSAEQENLGPGWNHVVLWGRVRLPPI